MAKTYYIIVKAFPDIIALYKKGQWIGRSYTLTKEQLARQIHESFCHATERYEADKTTVLPTLFREELNQRDLDKLIFRIDTVLLDNPDIIQRSDIRYYQDY